jgi:hypothetical protein
VTLTVRSTRTRFDLGPVNGMGDCSFSPTSSNLFFSGLWGGGGEITGLFGLFSHRFQKLRPKALRIFYRLTIVYNI